MSDKKKKKPFIFEDLRPKVGLDIFGRRSPLSLKPSKEEMEQRIDEVVKPYRKNRLGISKNSLPSDTLNKSFKRNSQIECTVLDKEAVLLNLENGIYYTLNRVSTVVWELLESEQSLEQILQAICERFEVSEEQAKDDIIRLIVQLEQEQLIFKISGEK